MPTARINDPDTSHEAAKSIDPDNVNETQRAILKLLATSPMNDDQLFQMYFQGAEHGYWKHASVSGVRSRRSELVRAGFVEDKGRTKTRFGRAAVIWGLK